MLRDARDAKTLKNPERIAEEIDGMWNNARDDCTGRRFLLARDWRGLEHPFPHHLVRMEGGRGGGNRRNRRLGVDSGCLLTLWLFLVSFSSQFRSLFPACTSLLRRFLPISLTFMFLSPFFPFFFLFFFGSGKMIHRILFWMPADAWESLRMLGKLT